MSQLISVWGCWVHRLVRCFHFATHSSNESGKTILPFLSNPKVTLDEPPCPSEANAAEARPGMSFCGRILVVKPGGVTPYSIGCVRPRPLKMDHIAFHRSSAVRIETVNDSISVFGRVVESR